MTKDMTKDMTKGDPLKLILAFSIPLLIGNLFQQFYSLIDTIIVGRFLGVGALAAVGSTGSLFFLIIGCVQGLTSGFAVLISQRFGAHDEFGVKKATASSLVLTVIMSIIITFIGLLLVDPLLTLMNTPPDIIEDATSYISVIFAGVFATFFYNMLGGILRAVGDSKTPLYFLIFSSILNIVLDLVFIINLSMGVSGAAYATVISQGVSVILCLIYIFKKFPILRLSKQYFKFDKEYYSKHLKIGIPMGIQLSIIAIGTIIVQTAVNSFGSTVIAATTAAQKVEQLAMQPSVSFGLALATYCAQNLGAGNIERVKEGVKKCTSINIVLGVFAGIMLIFFGSYFTSLFVSNSNPEVISYAQQYLTASGLFFIPLNMIFVFRNALQGMGYTFTPMLSGIYELLARCTAAFTLPLLIGYWGICIAGPIAWVSAAVPLAISYFNKINNLSSPVEEFCFDISN